MKKLMTTTILLLSSQIFAALPMGTQDISEMTTILNSEEVQNTFKFRGIHQIEKIEAFPGTINERGLPINGGSGWLISDQLGCSVNAVVTYHNTAGAGYDISINQLSCPVVD